MKVFALIGFLFLSLASWDESDYQNNDLDSFFGREDINENIDLDNLDKDLLDAVIFYATNEQRLKKKRKEFQFNPVLRDAARLHSEAMRKYNFFNHRNPKQKKFRTAFDRIEQSGGGFTAMAENIAQLNVYILGKKGTYFVKNGEKVDANGKPLQTKTYKQLALDVVDKWMNSKGHRKNILADYSFLGCSVSEIRINKNGLPELLITQNFGEM